MYRTYGFFLTRVGSSFEKFLINADDVGLSIWMKPAKKSFISIPTTRQSSFKHDLQGAQQQQNMCKFKIEIKPTMVWVDFN